MADSGTEMSDIDWDAIFEIDFVEESDSEDENSGSDEDESTIDGDGEAEQTSKKPLCVNDVEAIKAKKTPKQFESPTSDKTSTKFYENGEKLLLDTLAKMISDPFNKIQGSKHGKKIISFADCLLKNKSKCDEKKYHSILGKLWKAATAGDARKLPTTHCEKMWRAFHALCSSHDFVVECELFVYPALLSNASCRLFNQTFVTKLFENIILFKTTVVPSTVRGSQSEEEEITVVEENILMYAAGFVPFSLKKQCAKRKTKVDEFRQKIKCLSALGVDDELEKSQTFLEYTRSRIEKQNRGGLFLLNDAGYLFFKAVERHCRKFFKPSYISNNGSSDIRELVLKDIFNDKVALEHWAHATAGHPSSISLQVLQMCVKLWVNIRGHAFATNWVENFKQSQSVGKKKALRKELKDLTL